MTVYMNSFRQWSCFTCSVILHVHCPIHAKPIIPKYSFVYFTYLLFILCLYFLVITLIIENCFLWELKSYVHCSQF